MSEHEHTLDSGPPLPSGADLHQGPAMRRAFSRRIARGIGRVLGVVLFLIVAVLAIVRLLFVLSISVLLLVVGILAFPVVFPVHVYAVRRLTDTLVRRGRGDLAERLLQAEDRSFRYLFGDTHHLYILSLLDLAMLRKRAGQYDAARASFVELRRRVEWLHGKRGCYYALCQNNLGRIAYERGELEIASQFYKDAYAAAAKDSRDRRERGQYCVSSMNLAQIAAELGRFDEAANRIEDVMAVTMSVRDRAISDLDALYALASVYLERADYQNAEPLLTKVRDRAARSGFKIQQAAALMKLGIVSQMAGDDSTAEARMLEALGLYREVGGISSPEYVGMLGQLGNFYYNAWRPAEGKPVLLNALELARELKVPSVRWRTLKHLALWHSVMGDFDRALTYGREALSLVDAQPGNEPFDVASVLLDVGRCLFARRENDEAERMLTRSLEITRRVSGTDHIDCAVALFYLGSLHIRREEYDSAWDLLMQSVKATDTHIEREFARRSDRQRLESAAMIAPGWGLVLTLFVSRFVDSPEHCNAALDLVLRRKGITVDLAARRREAATQAEENESTRLLAQLDSVKSLVAEKHRDRRLGGQSASLDAELAKLLWERETLEREFAQRERHRLGEWLHAPSRNAVIAKLPRGAVLLEYVRVEDYQLDADGLERSSPRYIVFVVGHKPAAQASAIDLGSANSIDELAAEFRRVMAGPDVFDEIGIRLRECIWDPVVRRVQSMSDVVVAPDGALSLIPFHALPVGSGRYLVDNPRLRITYVTSGRDLLRIKRECASVIGEPFVVAAPDFDLVAPPVADSSAPASAANSPEHREPPTSPFRSLDGAREEGRQVARRFRVDAKMGADGLKTTVMSASSPRLLHLATHAYFHHDGAHYLAGELLPLQAAGSHVVRIRALHDPLSHAGLALTGANTFMRGGRMVPGAGDGLLTAENITTMNLNGTELVVLSACETAVGYASAGEGVFGLGRAFMIAGAKTVIMSLWKVPDEEAREFMFHMYEAMENGVTKADAVRQAQAEMRRVGTARPYTWATFVCYGDPGPLGFAHGDGTVRRG